MKQFEVEIMGQPYVLGCPEGGERRFHAAVAQVDGTMNRIRDAGKVRARDRIAVLAALNLALELVDSADRPAVVAPPAEPVPAVPDPAGAQDAARLEALLLRLDTALAQDAGASPADAAPQPQDIAEPADPDAAGPAQAPGAMGADAGPAAADEPLAASDEAPPHPETDPAASGRTGSADAPVPGDDAARHSPQAAGALPG